MIQQKLCQKLKFDHSTKWYMHKLKRVRNNEMHKILWDFKIQTDHIIPVKWIDLMIINKKKKEKRNWRIVNFAVPDDRRVKIKENKKRKKYLHLTLKQQWKMEMTIIATVIGTFGRSLKATKGDGKAGNRRTNWDHPDNSVVGIDRNKEKNSRDLRRLAVTQTPVKDHQLWLMWKTRNE